LIGKAENNDKKEKIVLDKKKTHNNKGKKGKNTVNLF